MIRFLLYILITPMVIAALILVGIVVLARWPIGGNGGRNSIDGQK